MPRHQQRKLIFAVCLFALAAAVGYVRWFVWADSTAQVVDSSAIPLQTQPDPALSPEQVVMIQLHALQRTEQNPAAMATCFNFASPANKQTTGPLERFSQMVRTPPYDMMLRHCGMQMQPTQLDGDKASIVVVLIDPAGRLARFQFDLSRQELGETADCWMTDAVTPTPTPPITPTPPAAQRRDSV